MENQRVWANASVLRGSAALEVARAEEIIEPATYIAGWQKSPSLRVFATRETGLRFIDLGHFFVMDRHRIAVQLS